MTAKEELKQFMAEHKDNPRLWAVLADMARRAAAGESMESIAASYGAVQEAQA